MDLSERSSNIIQLLKKRVKFQEISQSSNEALMILYHDIKKAHAYVKRLQNIGKLGGILKPLSHIDKPKMSSSNYFPRNIQTYINDNVKKFLVYKSRIHEREIILYFAIFNDTELYDDNNIYDKYSEFVFTWLHVCCEYSVRDCTKTLNIWFYFTPFKKILPSSNTSIIGPSNVNTAFTMNCIPNGEIVLFRKEEWKKVFIHETFHTFGLDFSSSNYNKLISDISKLFPVKSDFSITEAYTETWARIINVAMSSFYSLKKKSNIKEFMKLFQFCMGFEEYYSYFQCVKILSFMGLNYNDLLCSSESSICLRQNMYRESTHVLCYYIITMILLSDYNGFIEWCKSHNTLLLRFRATDSNFESFSKLIQDNAKNPELLEILDTMKKKLYSLKSKSPLINTLTMSATEL